MNTNELKSYVDTRLGLMGRASELLSLYRNHSISAEVRVKANLDEARAIQATLRDASGHTLAKNSKILEIGPGQQMVQLAYFALRCEAVGIDLDFLPDRGKLSDYLRMWRRNGSMRTLSTLR